MAMNSRWVLRCDSPDCDAEFVGEMVREFDTRNFCLTVNNSHRTGWTDAEAHDYCPKCSKGAS